MSKKLYVIQRPGRFIPRFGTRLYGEFWDNLPDDMVEELKDRAEFSLSAPGKQERKPERKPVSASKPIDEEMNDGER